MKGKIIQWKGGLGCGFILGEDGKEYFLHESEMIIGKPKRSVFVEFDVIERPNEKRGRAMHVKKIGHGEAHPFLKDLERLEGTIIKYVTDADEKMYRLNDIQMLKNYFKEICDFEQFPNVRAFRPKCRDDFEEKE
jgi:cold shock CspA family protein